MSEEAQIKREKLLGMYAQAQKPPGEIARPPVEAPKPKERDISRLTPTAVRQEVKGLVNGQERSAAIVIGTTFDMFMGAAENNAALKMQIRNSAMYTLLG